MVVLAGFYTTKPRKRATTRQCDLLGLAEGFGRTEVTARRWRWGRRPGPPPRPGGRRPGAGRRPRRPGCRRWWPGRRPPGRGRRPGGVWPWVGDAMAAAGRAGRPGGGGPRGRAASGPGWGTRWRRPVGPAGPAGAAQVAAAGRGQEAERGQAEGG